MILYYMGDRNIKKALQTEEQALKQAKNEADTIINEARKEASRGNDDIMEDLKNREGHVNAYKSRLDQKTNQLNSRIQRIEDIKKDLSDKQMDIEEKKAKLKQLNREQIVDLEKITNLSFDTVVSEIEKRYEEKYKEELQEYWSDNFEHLQENTERECENLTKLVIQRFTEGSSREAVSVAVDFKSKKNRKKFLGEDEEAYFNKLNETLETELTYEWDGHVLEIYGHDLLKRNIVKLTMQNLLKKPTLGLEKALKIAKDTISAELMKHGNWAVKTLKIKDLPEQLVKLIGRLNYRTSYGQNILRHSVEVAFICEMLAHELDADVELCKLGGLLHDIGKAIDTEVSGTHDALGRDIALKFKMDPVVVNAIYAHHEAEPFKTIEARIVQTADAISASRPGARHQESIEDYIERIEKLERITEQFKGIEKSFAISAGRELRVLVNPEDITDEQAKEMAKEIAKNIEDSLTYPGEIKVNLIREKKVIDYAN